MDLEGKRFARLTVVGPAAPDRRYGRRWKCVCDCGEEKTIDHFNLLKGKTGSCGCLHREQLKNRRFKHGLSASRIYGVWKGMKERCYRREHKYFKNYGGRGIKVCDRWHTFDNFYADMGERPIGKSLDRINVNGDYSSENCRWATSVEQMNNTRLKRIENFSDAELLAEIQRRKLQPNYGNTY